MKYLIKFNLIVVLLLSMSCQSDNEKNVIKGFIDTFLVVKSNDLKIGELQNYISYDKQTYNNLTIDQRKKTDEYLTFMINLGYENLKKNNFKYEIYSSEEINTSLISHYKISYPDKKKVYYVISENKIFSFFILDKNGKIISFFSRDFMSQGETIKPFILTQKNHLESLFNN